MVVDPCVLSHSSSYISFVQLLISGHLSQIINLIFLHIATGLNGSQELRLSLRLAVTDFITPYCSITKLYIRHQEKQERRPRAYSTILY